MHVIRTRSVLLVVLALFTLLTATGLLYQPTSLERVLRSGELRIIMLAPLPGALASPHDSLGLEHDLVREFAAELGVEPVLLLADSKEALYRAVAAGDADIAVGGLSLNPRRQADFRFTRPYLSVDQQLIYRFGNPAPSSLEALAGNGDGRLAVMAHSHHAKRLRALQEQELPDLRWEEITTGSPEELLFRVWNREVDYTLADSIDVKRTQRFYPELRVAFNVTEGVDLRWVLSGQGDDTLLRAADAFLAEAIELGLLAYLEEKHLGHLGEFDYVGARVFLRHVTERLPQFRSAFEEAAAEYGLDWRLLAAIGYQESHWNPRAVSPTGVRGLMMLTQRTAGALGIEDRLDPQQSIIGGARYLRSLLDRVPERIGEPTRTWFALAAYNVGMGHLEDARRLTELRGGNPDAWPDVKRTLPLLAQREWYQRTRYGYARGWEPVIYVRQVRMYYDLLTRITSDQDSAILATSPPSGIPYAAVQPGLRIGESLESAL